MTVDEAPGHDRDRAVRDAQREQERAASRARQQAAYRQAQRASRDRARRAAAQGTGRTGPAAEPPAPGQDCATPPPPLTAAPLLRAWRRAEDPRDRPPTELGALELAEERLEDAELQQALLDALAALPADQRVAVVAALGYDEGPVGAAVELGVEPARAEHLAQQGLDALRHALSPFLTRDD